MKRIISFISRKREAALMSLAAFFVSSGLHAQTADIGESLLSEAEESFTDLITNITSFIRVILVIGGIAMLVMVIFKIVKGDREAAEKFMYWLAGIVLGFALLTVMEGLIS